MIFPSGAKGFDLEIFVIKKPRGPFEPRRWPVLDLDELPRNPAIEFSRNNVCRVIIVSAECGNHKMFPR